MAKRIVLMSKEAENAIEYAKKTARELGHYVLCTEHLLLGLLHVRERSLVDALKGAGYSVRDIESKIARKIAHSQIGYPNVSEVCFSPRVSRIIRAAKVYSKHTRKMVEPDDFMHGIIKEGAGNAYRILKERGLLSRITGSRGE